MVPETNSMSLLGLPQKEKKSILLIHSLSLKSGCHFEIPFNLVVFTGLDSVLLFAKAAATLMPYRV